VKADGYGHGACPVAEAALAGGASDLAVAIVDEGLELRLRGIEAPVIVLSEPDEEAMPDARRHGLTPTLYTKGGIAAAARAVRALAAERPPPWPVEVKVDTGMHRVGAPPGEVAGLVAAIAEAPELDYAGLWTHFAVADEVTDPFTAEQVARFEAVRGELKEAGLPEPGRVHAANSAGAIAMARARYDMVRCGIALYGYAPSAEVRPRLEAELDRVGSPPLEPALSFKAKVTLTRLYEKGERLSYGRLAPLGTESLVATVPVGYADGLPRNYFASGGEILLGGRRWPLAGSVTMDQALVATDPAAGVRAGDTAVLIGSHGGEAITAEEWAERLGTIPYEIVTRIGPRVPRRLVGSAA
jgi:alanine racemase